MEEANATTELALPERQRKLALRFVWLCPALFLLLVFGWSLQIWLGRLPGQNDGETLSGMALVSALFAERWPTIRGGSRASCSKW